MYKQYIQIKNGKAFSSVQIPADMPIMELTGTVILDRDIKDDISNYTQIGPNTYLGPSGDVDDYIAHHCDPNCKLHIVGNRAILYSMYVIPAGAEINFDYSTTSTDAATTNCNCGSNKCRKIISGHHSLSPELKEVYKNKGMLPLYILEPNMIYKR